MSWKCPHCNDILGYLKYEVDITGSQYGTANLEDSPTRESIRTRHLFDIVTDHDCDDDNTDWDGNPTYSCPECDAELTISQLVWDNDDDEDDDDEDEDEEKPQKKNKEAEECTHRIISPQEEIIDYDVDEDILEDTIICKNCFHPYIFEQDSSNRDEFSECPHCGTSNTKKEFKELIQKAYFTKLKKKTHGKQKNTRSVPTVG